jgi:CMP-N,N'-diacetyllegionaminic acid synthase
MSNILALIPARSGSKGIKNKNIHPLNGRPLVEWSILSAKRVKKIDRIIVSTDGDLISSVVKELSVEVMQRPSDLAQDGSLVVDAIRYTINELSKQNYQVDYLILLEPTSPLRSEDDINNVILELENGVDSVATFCQAALNPHRAWSIDNKKPSVFIEGAVPWMPRQKLPNAWELNGAVYGINVKRFLSHDGVSLLFGNSSAVIMPEERSVDIDNLFDLAMVEAIMKKGNIK